MRRFVYLYCYLGPDNSYTSCGATAGRQAELMNATTLLLLLLLNEEIKVA